MNIVDPTGWCVDDNPHPPADCVKTGNPVKHKITREYYFWQDYMEWSLDGLHTVVCHSCIVRAWGDNGNCVDGGDYWLCLRDEDLLKSRSKAIKEFYGVEQKKEKKSVQTVLL